MASGNFKLLIICLFIFNTVQAQQTIKGKVVEEHTNEPIPFVSVFINTTTIGTSTDENGEFALKLEPGRYEIVVSYIGYEPIIYQLDKNDLSKLFLFKLRPKEYPLHEVEVRSTRDSIWYVNLEIFKDQFIGKSKIARKCKILNPEVLIISFDQPSGILAVQARDLLHIENPELGYKLTYLLTHFTYHTTDGYISYSGYPSYNLLAGNKAKIKRWERNRKKAYKGSVTHFVRALRARRLEEEGFSLRKLYRHPNPDRPSDEEIANARIALLEQGSQNLPADNPKSIILMKAKLPKFIEQLDTARVPYQKYLFNEENKVRLFFEGYFQVMYRGEKEARTFIDDAKLTGLRLPAYQTSIISLTDSSVYLEETGAIIEPTGLFFEGYWSWEKIGDMLPFDYITTK